MTSISAEKYTLNELLYASKTVLLCISAHTVHIGHMKKTILYSGYICTVDKIFGGLKAC
jgi:hypothetical protein